MQIYKTVGCEFCHGWSGNGGQAHDDHFGRVVDPGPSLVKSKLGRAEMIEVVSCGTPSSWMPQHLAEAWTPERRCYGKIAEDLAAEARPVKPSPSAIPPGPYRPLSQSQIEAVVAYVQETYQGKAMTLATCLKYHGAASRACDLLR